jgi:hypothetical protein
MAPARPMAAARLGGRSGRHMYIPVDGWLRAFLITVAVETPVVLWLLRGGGTSRPRLVVLGIFANLATHPVVWFVIQQLIWPDTPEYVAVAETWAIAAEAAFWWIVIPGLRPGRALAVAVLANACSYGTGLAVAAVWPGALG